MAGRPPPPNTAQCICRTPTPSRNHCWPEGGTCRPDPNPINSVPAELAAERRGQGTQLLSVFTQERGGMAGERSGLAGGDPFTLDPFTLLPWTLLPISPFTLLP